MKPIYHSFLSEDFDPLKVLQRLSPQGPGFLETLNPLAKTGRYTLVALRSRQAYALDENGLTRISPAGKTVLPGDPFVLLSDILDQYRLPVDNCPTPFPGGFFGWLGYDLVRWIEELPRIARRDSPLPALWLDWVDQTVVFDHETHQVTVASLDPEDDIHQLSRQVQQALSSPLPPCAPIEIDPPEPILSPDRFQEMVGTAKEYIASGDIYQANLSCRFDGRFDGKAADLYRRLREVNPSPFACYLNSPPLKIISSSPERLVSLRGDLAETRPIAGTRPRGFTPPEDHQLGKELLGHPKERAEHIMLLDLERNDLGKVCRPCTVEVDELMTLERYSHVTHIVSNVRGRIQPGLGPFDLIRATFPGGTITGVPKKRCMEIIEELEPVGRGTYTGSAGYISITGEMDLNILIRSYQLIDRHLTYQVGAGIVADSIPEKEWLECLAKGAALRKTLEDSC